MKSVIQRSPMAKDLRSSIHELVETFTSGVLQALRAATLEEWREHSSRQERVLRKSSHRTPKTTTEGADTLLDRMVAILRRNPKGVRSEDLRAQLGAEKMTFRLVAQEAIAADLISKSGERRRTTFFAR